MEFWDQVKTDAAALTGSSEVALPFLIVDGEGKHAASGLFELSYTEIETEGQIPIPSRYAALRVYEEKMPIRIRVGMQLKILGKGYQVVNIREPGLDGVTTLELHV
jgi:hypothetical protein